MFGPVLSLMFVPVCLSTVAKRITPLDGDGWPCHAENLKVWLKAWNANKLLLLLLSYLR